MATVLLVSTSALACRCPQQDDPVAYEYPLADLVILADATADPKSANEFDVILEVLETWKGQSPGTFSLRYGSGYGMCEFPIAPDHRYLMFMYKAEKSDGEFYASLCGATTYMDSELPAPLRQQLDELAAGES